MALDIDNLAPIGGQSSKGAAPQVWSAFTTDATGTVDGSGWANVAAKLLQVGDIIFVVRGAAVPPATPTDASIHVVMSNASGVVDLANETAIGIVDSD